MFPERTNLFLRPNRRVGDARGMWQQLVTAIVNTCESKLEPIT